FARRESVRSPTPVFETRGAGCYAFHGARARRTVVATARRRGGRRERDEESPASGSVPLAGRGLRGVGHGSRAAGREPAAAGRGGHGPTLAVGVWPHPVVVHEVVVHDQPVLVEHHHYYPLYDRIHPCREQDHGRHRGWFKHHGDDDDHHHHDDD